MVKCMVFGDQNYRYDSIWSWIPCMEGNFTTKLNNGKMLKIMKSSPEVSCTSHKNQGMAVICFKGTVLVHQHFMHGARLKTIMVLFLIQGGHVPVKIKFPENFPCVSAITLVLHQNSPCFSYLEKLISKFSVFPVPWPPCYYTVPR